MYCSTRAKRRSAFLLLPALAVLAAAGNLAAATLCVNPNGTAGCQSSINAAIAAASAGDVIVVQQGAYPGPVTITKSINLLAAANSVPRIYADGQANGLVIGNFAPPPAPNSSSPAVPVTTGVVVQGFEVQNAKYEGIVVVNASGITLIDNHVHNNDQALNVSAGTCPGINTTVETNEQADCGEGIHLIGASSSTVMRNLVEDNSGGILISDEVAPSNGNQIVGNTVRNNGYACGITMASHHSPYFNPDFEGDNFGVSGNSVSFNESYNNGTIKPNSGAGVGIFAPDLGSFATANSVSYNSLHDNGGPGVAVHNHVYADSRMTPHHVSLDSNSVVGNHIYNNGKDNAGITSGSTGVNLASFVSIANFTVNQNEFGDQDIDIGFYAPQSSTLTAQFNDFEGRGIGIGYSGAFPNSALNQSTFTVNAPYNWWGCNAGPSTQCRNLASPDGGLAPVKTLTVTTTPSLTNPFNLNKPQ
jgi:parallel beta-helix repeat protein